LVPDSKNLFKILRQAQDDKINRTLVHDGGFFICADFGLLIRQTSSATFSNAFQEMLEKAWKTIISSADMEITKSPVGTDVLGCPSKQLLLSSAGGATPPLQASQHIISPADIEVSTNP